MIAFLVIWNLLTLLVCVYLVRKALQKGRKSRIWRTEQRPVSAQYVTGGKHFTGIEYYVVRGTESIKIEPPEDNFCLDPSKPEFAEKLSSYRAAAKEVAITLNNDERLLNE